MTRARRSRDSAAPSQLALNLQCLPVPERGTILIMRLDDARGLGIRSDEIVPGNHAAWEDRLRSWLHGESGCLGDTAAVHRAGDGRVLSATAEAILAACPPTHARECLSPRSQQTALGLVMTRLGWSKERRRRFGGREYRYCAPPGWSA